MRGVAVGGFKPWSRSREAASADTAPDQRGAFQVSRPGESGDIRVETQVCAL